ncbi:MAG TPA: cytochrome c oxidase subunit 3 [Bacteroidia bacterium]|nr:cytochrome c oxidase subunit 3 [Bacteroidia bacterium]
METALIKEPEQKGLKEKTMKALLWLGIVSMIMLFAGLTSGYLVREMSGSWLHFELPALFWLSTAIIITSSATMNWAVMSAKQNDLKKLKLAITITLLLGIGFTFSQFAAWHVLISNNIFFTGVKSNASGSFLYVLTGLHLLHLFGGLICLSVVLTKSFLGRYSAENMLGLKLCAIYWHFLDALWIYLFLFLYFIR